MGTEFPATFYLELLEAVVLIRTSVKTFALISVARPFRYIDRINGNLNIPSCWLEVQVTKT